MLAFAASFLFIGVQSANAGPLPVSFSTSGTWSATANHPAITFTGATSPGGLTSPQSNVDLGFFTVGANNGLLSGDFTLQILQTVPTAGGTNTTVVGTISGRINSTSTPGKIQFTDLVAIIGVANTGIVTYTLTGLDGSNSLAFLPNTTPHVYANITHTDPVPEPSLIVLLGLSLGAVTLLACRWKN